MAFPVVQTTAETAVSTAGTSHAITLPSGIVAGDLTLLVMDIGSTAATLNALAGWTELLDENSANGLKIIYYSGAGVPSAPTFTSSASTRSATIAYRISAAEVPATQAPQIGTTATGSSINPDPPAVTPTGGAKDYLWIALFGRDGEEADDDTWVTAAPSGFTNLLQKACGVAGTNLGGMIASAQQQLNAASLNPGTFTCATGGWRAQTIAIHPTSAVSETPGIGAAVGSGLAAAAAVDVPQGSSLGQGATPSSAAAVPQGGAVAGGFAPTENIGGGGISETPTPGGAIGAGVAPVASVTAPQGGAVGQGASPTSQASVVSGGATGAGVSPTFTATAAVGGATGAGSAPATRVTLSIGGAFGGGVAPTDGGPLTETPIPGGALGQGTGPVASVIFSISGVSAGGFSPTVSSSTPTRWPPDSDSRWAATTLANWAVSAASHWPFDTDQNW